MEKSFIDTDFAQLAARLRESRIYTATYRLTEAMLDGLVKLGLVDGKNEFGSIKADILSLNPEQIAAGIENAPLLMAHKALKVYHEKINWDEILKDHGGLYQKFKEFATGPAHEFFFKHRGSV